MSKLSFRRQIWLMVLASGFGSACTGSTEAMPTALPAPCTAGPLDALVPPSLLSPAHGSVTGSDLVARLCAGGASAYLEHIAPTTSQPNTFLLYISSYTVDRSRNFQIALPTDATRLELSATVDLHAAQPGTVTESNACGYVVLCAIRPAPPSVHCPSALQGDTCPPGCAMTGSSSCVPTEPATCFAAATNPTCAGGSANAEGSWRVTVSSVERYTGPPSGGANGDLFTVHGSLDATLVKSMDTSREVDAGAARMTPANLSLTF